MTIRKGPVNVDDQENIERFLEQMMRKNHEAAFTSSKPSDTSTTNDNTVQTATTPPEVLSPEVDKPQGQLTMLSPPARASSANTPVATQPDANASISTSKTMQRSRGVSLNTGPNDALAPHQLPQWMEENCPPSHRSPTRTAAPHTLVDKFLQSPQMSGLQAPPPTPETGPVSQYEVTNIILGAFDELHNDHPPAFTLGDSKYAPRRKTLLGQTGSDLQHSSEYEGYTPFTTPNRELSENSRHGRDEAFERMKSQLSPRQGHSTVSTADGDGKGSNEGLQLLSPVNVGPQAHVIPIKLSTGVNEDNNNESILMNPFSRSAQAIAEDATAIHFSQAAHQLDLSSEQDSSKQISKFQAVIVGQHCTNNAELTVSKAAASLERFDGSADLGSTGGHWIPPNLRPPTKESLDKKPYKGEVTRTVVENLGQAGPHKSLKREDGSLVTKFRNISEINSNKSETPPSRLHSKRPSIIFTGENHKNTAPLTRIPFIATAATASSGIARGTSEVPANVAVVDNSLSALGGLFGPIPAAKMPISINTSHPLSAKGNPSSGTLSTPRSVDEMGVITPSSMTFSAVSPATAAAAGITAAIREANGRSNLEDVLFFKSWPKSDDERRPGKPLLFCPGKECIV